jgi:hypothetical protein
MTRIQTSMTYVRTGIYVGTAVPGCPVERSSTVFSPGKQLPGFARPDSREPAQSLSKGRLSPHVFLVLLGTVLLLTTLASAQTLTGTVKNSTTGKAAAGDDVILLSLGQGMEESGRTKADAKGNFSFKLNANDAQAPHLVRAVHDGVTYHRMAPPGTTSVELEVFDVDKKVEGVAVVADIMRVQAAQGSMEVLRAFAVQNTSKPPRTQMNERNLEFYLPAGAKILQAEATTENGNPLKTAPVPENGDNTRYAFNFPLRPGVTQFEVEYELPYTGSANIDPRSLYPLQHFVAIVPKAMQFAAATGTKYQAMNDPQQPDANVQVASGTKEGQTLAFKITGEGTLQSRNENAGAPGEATAGQGGSAQAESRPGGGLGPPIDAPDPLQKYRWWILGGFAAVLVVGGVYVASRQQSAARDGGRGKLASIDDPDGDFPLPEPVARQQQSTSAARSSRSMLLEGLKEELFQLEVERNQGQISQQEYEKAKSALDQTLERALKREAQKA